MSKSNELIIQNAYLDQSYTLSGRLIDPILGTLSWQGQSTHLRRKELEVLALLASADGAVVSRQEFVNVVWDGNDLVGDRAVTDTIFSLRRALRDDDPNVLLIRTIPRRGYRLGVAAQPVEAQQPGLSPGNEVLHSAGWRLVRKLGESALSESWLAEASEYNAETENSTSRVFRFCRSESYLRRLQREVTLLRYVNQSLAEHPGFAVIRDWQLEEPPYFLARDYTRFGSLGQWTQVSGMPQMPPLRLMAGLSGALAALHQLGVVHRNLSPDRILVDETDAGPQFKISALGLGALTDRRKLELLQITALGLTIGAEEVEAQANSSEDVAALGLVFLQLSVGDWQAEANEEWLNRVNNTDLQKLLRQCLGEATARPTAAELAQRLGFIDSPGSSEPLAIPLTSLVLPPPSKSSKAEAPLDSLETIGRYRLLDRLGEGGMGIVYLAEQRDPYRKVALKIIRTGLDGQQILSRFEAERQALAMMNHPNVASVLDSGLAADGRPFFAMEYIAGDDIKSYCDRHRLNINARIKLFLQVCDGVLHAHQKGVLHRDIKPGNLMVTASQDNAPSIKVIDFGLAKSMHGKLAAHTLHTSFGAFIGTPVYSSPEHVAGSAAGVDTRSDIYSMGVVLYELLVGMTPIASESLANLEPEKIRELVCKSRLPSMREQLQNTTADKRAELAEHRAIKVDELPKTLDGDLSWVVGKCLERDPNDRYASVLSLKDDLERWLDLRPVEARPPSDWYRFRKLVQRNRGTAILIACASAALLFASTAAILGYLRAERALEASRLAEAEATKAADFQVKQIQSVDPAAMGVSLRERMILALRKRGDERGWEPSAIANGEQQFSELFDGVNFTDLSLAQLDTHQFQPTLASITNDFKDQPLLQARLWQSLADSLVKLGRIEAAAEPQKLALEQRKRLRGVDDPLTLISLRAYGALLLKQGQNQQAEAELRTAAASMQRVLGVHHPETLTAKTRIGEALLKQNRFEDALVPAREVLDGSRQALGENHHATADAKSLMGSILSRLQRFAEAETYYRESLEWYIRDRGSQSPQANTLKSNLAIVLTVTGRYGEAHTILSQVLSDQRTRLGNDHESTLSTQLNLIMALRYQERFVEAEAMTRQIIEASKRVFGSEHPRSINAESILAQILVSRGKTAEAVARSRQVLATARRNLTKDDTVWERYILHLAIALRENGEFDEANTLLRDVLQTQRRQWGDSHRTTLLTMNELATLSEAQGDLEAAEKLLREAQAVRRKIQGDTGPSTLNTLDQLARVLRLRGKLDEALAISQEVLDAASKQQYPGQSPVSLYQVHQAQTLIDLRRFDDAEKLLEEAKGGLSQDAYPARDTVKKLAEGFIALYAQKQKIQPELDVDSKARRWQAIIETMQNEPDRLAAEILSGQTRSAYR